jgi:hypothetical protein
MKNKEREILNKLNNFFLVDVLVEDKYEYNRYDAENKYYIVEIKYRESFYEEVMIEFDKFSYNVLCSQLVKKQFIYAVKMKDEIYVFNITKLVSSGHKFKWIWKDNLPKQTEFADKRKIKKLVGYININQSVRTIYAK